MTTSRESGVTIYDIAPRCQGETLRERECKELKPNTWAVFAMKIRVNYLNCRYIGDDGLCVPQAMDDTFDYKLMLTNAYDCSGNSCSAGDIADPNTCNGKTGGMVIMVDGVVMGKVRQSHAHTSNV